MKEKKNSKNENTKVSGGYGTHLPTSQPTQSLKCSMPLKLNWGRAVILTNQTALKDSDFNSYFVEFSH